MLTNPKFKPLHINCDPDDLLGNQKSGRYLFLPGSNARAVSIADYFDSPAKIKRSSRGHDLYLGTITRNQVTIDVGVISTGMGAPSIDIILTELLQLGGKRFLRLGTCGLLQPDLMCGGDLAIATSAVRDESTTSCYVPLAYPAIASPEMLQAIIESMANVDRAGHFHVGVFHTKASLYAREFKRGPMKQENTQFMANLKRAGVIASEMETSVLFTLCGIADGPCGDTGCVTNRILAGAICSVLGEGDDFGTQEQNIRCTKDLIESGIQAFFQLKQKGL